VVSEILVHESFLQSIHVPLHVGVMSQRLYYISYHGLHSEVIVCVHFLVTTCLCAVVYTSCSHVMEFRLYKCYWQLLVAIYPRYDAQEISSKP